MARSDLLKAMFTSYSKGDDAAFRRIALQVIEEERRKNHSLLADELERLLAGGKPTKQPLHVAVETKIMSRFTQSWRHNCEWRSNSRFGLRSK